MSEDETTLNVDGLDKILKALKAKMPVARIGILGGGARSGGKGGVTNATVGAAHEFGTSKLPPRSFLRVPIADNLNKRMEASGALDASTLKEVIKSGSVLPWITKVAILAEDIVLGAFESGGYGKWAPWGTSASTLKNFGRKLGIIKAARPYTNQTGQILLDTQQLRNSITYDVKG